MGEAASVAMEVLIEGETLSGAAIELQTRWGFVSAWSLEIRQDKETQVQKKVMYHSK